MIGQSLTCFNCNERSAAASFENGSETCVVTREHQSFESGSVKHVSEKHVYAFLHRMLPTRPDQLLKAELVLQPDIRREELVCSRVSERDNGLLMERRAQEYLPHQEVLSPRSE